MKIYLVGGAVRDKLLGLPVKERDWVVVGATVDDMLAKHYRQVGKEFPVFLHPKTNEEYALARTERKTAPGYKGFQFDSSTHVTLEEDLSRRDLTINAMALEDIYANDESIDIEKLKTLVIDPYHGQEDLDKRILRHVSDAFVEDPVRILRIARFLARYKSRGFKIAPETISLMQQMVQSGEVNALVPERVWKELERALEERNPECFFQTLEECGALAILFPGITTISNGFQAMIAAAKLTETQDDPGIIRFAALMHDLPDSKKTISSLCKQWRVPNAYKELAMLTALHYKAILLYEAALNFEVAINAEATLTAALTDGLLKLFNALDIYRRKERFTDFVETCSAIAKLTNNDLFEKEQFFFAKTPKKFDFDAKNIYKCAEAAKSVDIKALLKQGLIGQALADSINQERRKKIEECINSISK